MINKQKAFTIIELIVTLTILGIILAITVPTILNLIQPSTVSAFKSDARIILKTALSKYSQGGNFDITDLSASNLAGELSITSNNFKTLGIEVYDNNIGFRTVAIRIEGQAKWDGYYACGTYSNMRVTQNEAKCTGDLFPPELTILGDDPSNIFLGEQYIDAGATSIDAVDGDITSNIIVESSVDVNVPGTYTVIYTSIDSNDNAVVGRRKVNVIDNVGPNITFTPDGNSVYTKNGSSIINVSDDSAIDINSFKYVWTTSITMPDQATFVDTYDDNQNIPTPIDVTGGYYLWATAKDVLENERYTVSKVFNLDNTIPVITLTGNSNVTINKGSIYSDAGSSATDITDGNITSNIITTGNVNPSVVGTYTIIYNVSDSSGNIATPVVRTINVIDVLAPVITILGSNPTTIYANATYSDAGATALDDVDGDVTSKIVTTGAVNPSVIGIYTITYTVKDKANNQAVAARTVNVIDNIAPTVVFGTNGNSTYAKARGTTVTLSDAHSGLNTSSLKYLWNTSTTAPSEASITTSFTNGGVINTPAGVTGGYYLWILGKDIAGNIVITRTNVFNLDNTIPVITMAGNNPVYVNIGNTYSDAGSSATDNINGTITSSIGVSSTVNTNVTGTYTVTYNVSDSSGNAATALSRTVYVQGLTQYRYRTSSTSQSCSTCYQTCYNYVTGTASYSCSSGSLSGSSCVSSYYVFSTFTATYHCSSAGVWLWSSQTCSGNCSAPCSDGSSANGNQISSSCPPTSSCSWGASSSCNNNWMGMCVTSTAANVTYVCPGGYSGGGSSSTCYQGYSCNPYSCNCTPYTVWSDWSSWSTTPVSGSSTVQVETRACTSWPCSAS